MPAEPRLSTYCEVGLTFDFALFVAICHGCNYSCGAPRWVCEVCLGFGAVPACCCALVVGDGSLPSCFALVLGALRGFVGAMILGDVLSPHETKNTLKVTKLLDFII